MILLTLFPDNQGGGGGSFTFEICVGGGEAESRKGMSQNIQIYVSVRCVRRLFFCNNQLKN